MDYDAKSSDELTLKEGEKVKVYKKYCHWSYTYVQKHKPFFYELNADMSE